MTMILRRCRRVRQFFVTDKGKSSSWCRNNNNNSIRLRSVLQSRPFSCCLWNDNNDISIKMNNNHKKSDMIAIAKSIPTGGVSLSSSYLLRQRNSAFFSTTTNESTDSNSSSNDNSSSKNNNYPDRANVVIVGGGIIGVSTAYHLSKLGIQDILLLERDKLTSGTTWHAAGLINTFGSLSSTSTFMRKYSKELYSSILPEETGMDTGYMPVGFIELACDEDRLHYYRRVAAFNRFCGVDVREIPPEEVKERFPLCKTDDVLAGFYVPTDGRVNPVDATMALARGARQNGVEIREDAVVSGITTVNTTNAASSNNGEKGKEILIPGVSSVVMSCGQEIKANAIVNCAGMWARQFGERCKVNIPNQAAEHYYLITDDMGPGVIDPSWPVIEDSSRCVYIRPEGGGLMFGLFEWEGASWNAHGDGIPNNFSFGEIQPDWDRMGPYLENAMGRIPSAINVGAKSFFCGPESFTPDNAPIVGEAPELRNYFVAAGLNSVGILTGGGIGKILAEWIHKGHAPDDVDVTGINIDRFHKYQNNPEYRASRVGEALGNTYKLHYPDHMPSTCRGAKKSALHDRLGGTNNDGSGPNAYFRDVSGWESPSWYATSGERPPVVERESFGRENWFPYWEAEHLACRKDVALFDMSFMSKFLVQGKDAGNFLNRLSTANIDNDSANGGQITYTQWLNERGFVEADLTVTKLHDNKFLVVATDTMHNHVYSHMAKHLSKDLHAVVTDVSAAYTQINLQGPRSRELLQSLTSHDLTDFKFRDAREIDIGLARLYCTRITYVGELGFELFIPVEQACHVYDRIINKGKEFNLRHAGLRALGSLRMEKGYRDYGHDIDNTDTLLECGLGFTCDFEKCGGFVGMDHVLSQKAAAKQQGGLTKRLAQVFLEDPKPLLHHGEILYRDNSMVCEIRSASYGHTLGGAVGLAMLENQNNNPINKKYIQSGDWQIQIANERFPCQVSLAPLYDPKNTKIKA